MKTYRVTWTLFDGTHLNVWVRANSLAEAEAAARRPDSIVAGVHVFEMPDHFYQETTV